MLKDVRPKNTNIRGPYRIKQEDRHEKFFLFNHQHRSAPSKNENHYPSHPTSNQVFTITQEVIVSSVVYQRRDCICETFRLGK